MLNNKTLIISLVFSLALSARGFSAPSLQSLLSPTSAEALLKGERVWHTSYEGKLALLASGFAAETAQKYLDETEASFSEEVLYFAPAGFAPEKSPLEIFNSILDISSLEQARVKKNDDSYSPLFQKISIFFDKDKKEELKTPLVLEELPDSMSLYASMRDDRLGSIFYQFDYTARESGIALSMLNLVPLRYLFFGIADKESLRTTFIQMPTAEGVLYVAHIAGHINNLDSIKKRLDLPSFFSRRIEGLKAWFFKQAYGLNIVQTRLPSVLRMEESNAAS